MAEKPTSDQLNKKDLEIILEVNKKAVELSTVVADQYEESIKILNDIQEDNKKTHNSLDKITTLSVDNQNLISKKIDDSVVKKIDDLKKQNEELSRDMFQIKVLYISAFASIILQIIQMFMKK